MTWGLAVDRMAPRDLIAAVERTTSGNIAVRIGQEIDDVYWEQCAFVVLSPDEARHLGRCLIDAAGLGQIACETKP